jgi:hypothetical protein
MKRIGHLVAVSKPGPAGSYKAEPAGIVSWREPERKSTPGTKVK